MNEIKNRPDRRKVEAWDAESVLGPAIRHVPSGLTFSLIAPMRHHDVIREMARLGIPTPVGAIQGYEQGFMTVLGFLDRQHTARLIGHKGGLLTSEDLW